MSGKGQIYGRLFVELSPPELDYVLLRVNSHRHVLVRSKERVALSWNDKIRLEEIRTNLFGEKDLHLRINGLALGPGDVRNVGALCGPRGKKAHPVQVKKGSLLLGEIFFDVEGS